MNTTTAIAPRLHVTAAQGDPQLRRIALMVPLSALILAVLLHRAELVIHPFAAGTLSFATGFAILGALAWAGARSPRAGLRLAGRVSGYFALFILLCLIPAVGSYPVAALSHGYVDATLQRADEALGFDWLAWYDVTAAHPWVQHFGRAAYQSIFVSPAILLVHYARENLRAEAARFLATVWLASVVTLALFWLMPAVGPFAYLWHGAAPYMPSSELWQPQVIPALRAHALHAIDLGHLVGLVSAPSFHTAADVILIAFAWRHTSLRLLLVPLNLAMLLSIPVEGTHYLSDMLLGAGSGGIRAMGCAVAAQCAGGGGAAAVADGRDRLTAPLAHSAHQQISG